jgi:hypothetical protein
MSGTIERLSILALLLAITIPGCDEPRKDYEVYLDDETGQWVVDHPRTDAVWLRCPVGQEWNDESSRCDGAVTLLGFEEAKDACPQGFSWPGDDDFATVLCDPVDISNCDTQYGSCSDCARCRLMFEIDTGRYVSSSSEGQTGGVTVYDFATGCADWGGNPESTNINVRCVKD